MALPNYKCIECGKKIAPERAFSALSRGKAPLFDSSACSSRHRQRRYHDRKKG